MKVLISADYSINEDRSDAIKSLKLILKPWEWYKGKHTQKVKNQLKKFFPKHNIQLFLTGRSALYNTLKGLKLKKNDGVAITGFTCEAVVLPVLYNNLNPMYIDIETKTYSMDLSDLKIKLNSKIKVIILQHSFGLIPRFRNEIIELARRKKIIVIEDLAHGFSTKFFKEDTKNTIKLLSFGRSKALSSVFGGAILTKNYNLYTQIHSNYIKLKQPSRLWMFRVLLYKSVSVLNKALYNKISIGKFLHKVFNVLNLIPREVSKLEKRGVFDMRMNKKYPDVLAQLLLTQLKKLKQTQLKRTSIVRYYSTSLKLYKEIIQTYEKQPLSRFPILVQNKKEVLRLGSQRSIYLGKWYSQVIAPEGLNQYKLGYVKGFCPISEKICKKIINLPTNIEIENAKKVIKFIDRYARINY